MQGRDKEEQQSKREGTKLAKNARSGASLPDEKKSGQGGGKISHHQITLPKGGGAIAGMGEKFQANPVTGTASFSVPVPVTPDRSGFEPKMSLSYDSGSGNSVFGLGWNIDIPNISRKTSKSLPKYDDGFESDVFLLSGAEDLVPVVNDEGERTGLYRPRIEGLFARIEKVSGEDGVYWRATTKENVTSIYGKTSDCRIADPDDETKVFEWLLQCTYDAKGNVIWYRHKAEDTVDVANSPQEANRLGTAPVRKISNKHISEIHYGIKIGTDRSTVESADPAVVGEFFHYSLVFDYGEQEEDEVPDYSTRNNPWSARLDPFSRHQSGFDMRTYRLCRRITLFHRFENDLGSEPVPVKGLVLGHDENETATYLKELTVVGYKELGDDNWEVGALPPLSLEYSSATLNPSVNHVDSESLENLPRGIGGSYQFLDFEGEGLSGIFVEQGDAWFYKPNNGGGSFGALKRLSEKPAPSQLGGSPQLLDVDGDGNNELLLTGDAYSGYCSYIDGKWEDFQYFKNRLNLDLGDPRLKQIDLTGDGRPDLLIAEDNVFSWHESLLKEGYGEENRRTHPCDEEKGPRVVFSEAIQTVFLADMSGDGLTDIVRIRNSEVCYWPNLGYGRFGAKITMGGAPYFDSPDRFNPAFVKLGDVDGSGTADIFYFGNGALSCWFNQSGNSFREMTDAEKPRFLPVDSATEVSIVDLLGNGTSCLVWSTANPGQEHLQMSYVDLMSGKKPHLLTTINNNMGKQVDIAYAASTEDYLRDRAAGAPWITKLPFPVQVIRSVTTNDLIGGTVHHALYKYHHGFFDGPEREFRGFGFVETLDTKSFEAYSDTPQEQYVKPVLTKTWFHNGAFIKQGIISQQYAAEYFPGVDAENSDVLPDTVIEDEPSLSIEELREAYRSMKTKTLRQEVWEADPDTGTAVGNGPYTVAESNFIIRRIQEKADRKNAVFVVHPRETLTWHYEQNPSDPRIAHELTLEVDDYGNILKTASVVYPRSNNENGYKEEQGVLYATCSQSGFTNIDPALGGSFYRVGAAVESRSFELGGVQSVYEGLVDEKYLPFDTVRGHANTSLNNPIPFEQAIDPDDTTAQARLLSHQRFLYWNTDQNAALPHGQTTETALLHHVETAVFTPGLITNAYGTDISTTDLETAGYFLADGYWWNPGLIQHYSTGDFYLPIRTEDPWGNGVDVTWDEYSMAAIETADALGNTSTAEIDYRTMSPRLLTDPNNNKAEAITDALGMVIATSMYGEEQGVLKGDDPLDSYVVNQTPTKADILANPETYLQNATTFFFYDLEAFTPDPNNPDKVLEPIQAVGLARETHVSNEAGTPSRIQKTIIYTDGFGRELQTKLKVEDGPAWEKDGHNFVWNEGPIERWLASGRTVYNNKEKPVKRYEPFYTASAAYEPEEFFATYGVTPIIHYDPLLRAIKTDIPYKKQSDGTTVHVHSKVEFTPWQIKAYDANDTILASEYNDIYDELSPEEQAAFDKAAAHANTPQSADLDTLGRQFLTTEMLSDTHLLKTKTTFDITGKPLTVVDPRQQVLNESRSDTEKISTFKYIYDMTGQTLRTVNIDAGDDRVFANVMGNPVISLDLRGHKIIAEYDVLHRLTFKRVEGGDVTTLGNVVEVMQYGESHPDSVNFNMRGRLWKSYDPSGRNTAVSYDFKGQALTSEKQIRTEYKTEADWPDTESSREALLETEVFTTSMTYDALGRVIQQDNPDTSITRPEYLQSGKLDRVHVMLNGEATDTDFVTGITYNAKGQREQINYGNGTQTVYAYDAVTFRLTSLVTTRTSDSQELQNITYVYDPVGNIVKINDASHERVFTTTGSVDAAQTYTYDALYRLTEATGREHTALTDTPFFNDSSQFKQSRHTLLNDMTQLANYGRQYTYDDAGNLTTIQHVGTNPFTRNIDVDTGTNRALLRPDVGTPDFAVSFDNNGNQIKIDHLAIIEWNYRDNIAKSVIIERTGGTDDAEYYTYDASGQRTRKVTERVNSGIVEIEEKIYLGTVEIKRFYQLDGSLTKRLDRSDLHVTDDKSRIAIVNHWTQDDLLREIEDNSWLNTNRQRYQYSNHLGSASLELNASAAIISYEEYYPYGGTSFIAGNNQKEVKLKEYRFSAKERDDSTGFYYHGARYYAPWMGRWMSADPAGPVDGVNLYVYVSNNPVRKIDPGGTSEIDSGMTNEEKLQYMGELEQQGANHVEADVHEVQGEHPHEIGWGEAITKKVGEKIDAAVDAAVNEVKGLFNKSADELTVDALSMAMGTLPKMAEELPGGDTAVAIGAGGPDPISKQIEAAEEIQQSIITGDKEGAVEHALEAGGAGLKIAGTAIGAVQGSRQAFGGAKSGITPKGQTKVGIEATRGGTKADDVLHVTPDGVTLPKGPKHKIPEGYVENPHRPGSYGEVVNGKFKERLRIDPATPPGRKGPNRSHYHRDGKGAHYSPAPGDKDPGFQP